jgi:glutaredoxin-like YruB-family protein
MKIKVYTTPNCPYCHQLLEFLKENKVIFEEIDVSKNQSAAEEMVKISGQFGVPVIIFGKKMIVGFNEEEIKKLLKKS